MDFSDLQEKYGGFQRYDPKKPKVTGRGGVATSLISEAAGTGGALGGAALGASLGSVVPGIGTIIGGGIGGLIGGFGGGFGGRAVENKVRDDEFNLDKALQEGLISGAFGAGGGALRGVKAAGTGIKALSSSDDVARAVSSVDDIGMTGRSLSKAAKQTAGKNISTRQGRQLYRSTLGVDDIVTPGKTKPNTIFKADELVDSAQTYGLSGSPQAMQRQAAVKFEELGSKARNIAGKLDDTVPLRGKNGIIPSINKEVSQNLPIAVDGVAVKRELARVVNEFGEYATSGKIAAPGLVEMKQRLSGRLSSAFNKLANGQDLTSKELVDMTVWNKLDDLMPNAIKSVTREQSKIYGLAQGLATQTRSLGQPTSFFEAGTRIAGRPIQSVQNAIGRGLIGVGGTGSSGISGSVGSAIGTGLGIGRQVVPGIAGRGAADAYVNNLSQTQPLDQTLSLEDALLQGQTGEFGGLQGVGGAEQFGQAEQPVEQSPYPRENLIYDIQRDPANAQDYINYYQQLQEVFAPPEEFGSNLTSTQLKSAAAAQNALIDVPLLQEAINSGQLGGAKNIPGAGTAVGRRLLGTENLDSALFNIADNILRARSGAAAPEEEVKRFVETFLPGPLDSQEAKNFKLQRAVRELQGYVNPQAASEGNFEDILMQLQDGGLR